MKKISFLALICIVYLAAIQCSRTHDSSIPVLHNDISDFKVQDLKFSEVSFSREFIHARDFFVYSDSILIVLNKPTAGKFLEIYNINTEECLGKLIGVGNGPKEMLNVFGELYGNIFVADDFIKSNYLQINLDEFLAQRDSYSLNDLKSYINGSGCPVMNFYPISDSRLLIANPYCFESDELGINNMEPRFFYNTRPDWPCPVNAANVNQGSILVSHKDSLIVFLSSNEAFMELYDLGLNPLVKVIGPTDLKVRHTLTDHESIAFKDFIPHAYRSAIPYGAHFLTIYHGNTLSKTGQVSDRTSYLLEYNWDGELLDVRRANTLLGTISTTSDNNIFYASGEDQDGTIILYKLQK